MTGHLGIKLGYDRIETKPDELKKAYRLGQKLVTDIEQQKTYPFQKLLQRIFNRLIIKRIILKNIDKNKDGSMKAVYDNLVARKLI
jgi:hypothetical protein